MELTLRPWILYQNLLGVSYDLCLVPQACQAPYGRMLEMPDVVIHPLGRPKQLLRSRWNLQEECCHSRRAALVP